MFLSFHLETIPSPTNVTAIERKSRRTVRLKWHSNGLNNIEPIFYVIEAQWTLPRTNNEQQDTISKWGFVKEEVSQTKAIIRNIQRDNRWYTFRVATVTRQGYSPFSKATKPFRLSSNFSKKIFFAVIPCLSFVYFKKIIRINCYKQSHRLAILQSKIFN